VHSTEIAWSPNLMHRSCQQNELLHNRHRDLWDTDSGKWFGNAIGQVPSLQNNERHCVPACAGTTAWRGDRGDDMA
jgi:hypothetical protein